MLQCSLFALGSACGSKLMCFCKGTCDQAVVAWVWQLLQSHPPT